MGNERTALESLELGTAAAPLQGYAASGDRHLIQSVPRGLLLCVVDGLGHGQEAAVAAEIAVGVVSRHADDSVFTLVGRCHEALQRTRGAVMSLAEIDPEGATLTWLGVGNVEGVLARANGARERLLLRAGVVGYKLPTIGASILPLAPGDLLVMATDGIDVLFTERLAKGGRAQQIADDILRDYGRKTDDALVVVARYLGREK